MDVEKSDKALFAHDQDCLPGVLTAHRQHRVSRLRRFLAHAAIALSLFLLYNAYTSQRFLGKRMPKSFNNYIKNVEESFLAVPSTESALRASRHYATHPHLAGAPEDLKDAKDILSLFQAEFAIAPPSTYPIFDAGSTESREATLSTTSSKFGKPSAWIDVYFPVLNTGNADGITLQLLGSDGEPTWTADLLEDGDPADETAARYKHAIPPFHGLSAPGEAVGQIVYANYGTKDDYDKLVEAGVDLTGKIVLARYGANFRGLKIQGAEQHGAAGVLIYTDPRDDGSVTVENGYEPYPAGPARNPTAIQRGSVQYLSTYPGDPTTPGYPAYPNATRLEGGNVPSIPSIPLSWANAKYLFEQELGGIEEGRKLDGKVGTHLVKMTNDVDTKVTPIWNTMAAIPGHIQDEVVILGCHRDAWVMGAADPTSGTVSLREVVRGLGALVRRGWKPLRTILVASWDAEEYGLVGSTEWGEDFADWIQAHAVSYVNVDVSVSGSQWYPSGSPSLAHLIKRSAQDVPHPTDPTKSVWDALYDSGPYTGAGSDAEFARMWAEKNASRFAVDDDAAFVAPLGSGSDYTVFLQRLGVASSDQGFGQTPTDAPYHYHSIYDSQMWQEKYADPGFHRHVALAKSLGLLTLRLADSIVVPLNTTQYALALNDYVDTLEQSAKSQGTPNPPTAPLRKAIKKLVQSSKKLDAEKLKAEKALLKALKKLDLGDRGRHVVRRVIEWVKRHLGIGVGGGDAAAVRGRRHRDLEYAALTKVARSRSCSRSRFQASGEEEEVGDGGVMECKRGPICDVVNAAARVRSVNKKLAAFERGFISEGGVKDREWYRHLGVAPGKYLGYGATTLPALTEAVLYEDDPGLVEYEVERLAGLIKKMARELKP
ncbi:Zn-dependent exopeptidase [Phlebopus sp. FC_14]|nr:Zn-dependent exopeptidase [Phlebopus sp. FC_14]